MSDEKEARGYLQALASKMTEELEGLKSSGYATIPRVSRSVVIYQALDAVFHHQMKRREESWKYDMQQSIFEELWGVSSGD